MFLAVKGNINAVFKLQKPDIPTIEKYIFNIPHNTFKTKKEAYQYIGIATIPKSNDNHFQFQECVRTLKAVGVIPEEEVVVAFSPVQNVKDDIEREKIYNQRKLETERNKLRRVSEDNISSVDERNRGVIFVAEISDNSSIHNVIEIDNAIINSDLFTGDMRQALLEYVRAGGNKNAIGTFYGKVFKITNNAILFKKLSIRFKKPDGIFEHKAETHIWIPDCEEFKNIGVQEGDCLKFKAIAYFYQRQNGTVDISLKAPHSIRFVRKYRLPEL